MGVAVGSRIEHALGETAPVPEIHEDQAAVVSPTMRPSHHGDRLSGLVASQLAARVRPPPASERLRHRDPPTRWAVNIAGTISRAPRGSNGAGLPQGATCSEVGRTITYRETPACWSPPAPACRVPRLELIADASGEQIGILGAHAIPVEAVEVEVAAVEGGPREQMRVHGVEAQPGREPVGDSGTELDPDEALFPERRRQARVVGSTQCRPRRPRRAGQLAEGPGAGAELERAAGDVSSGGATGRHGEGPEDGCAGRRVDV